MTRVLLVAGDATESLDTWYPYLRLREEGIEVHIGAPVKKVLKSVVHDFESGWDTYVEKPGYHIPADIGFADVLHKMGADLIFGRDFVTVRGTGELEAIDVDLLGMPDTAQTLAVVARLRVRPEREQGHAVGDDIPIGIRRRVRPEFQRDIFRHHQRERIADQARHRDTHAQRRELV